jgi:hypothetical protein
LLKALPARLVVVSIPLKTILLVDVLCVYNPQGCICKTAGADDVRQQQPNNKEKQQ